MTLEADGSQRIPQAMDEATVDRLRKIFDATGAARPGVRMSGEPFMTDLLGTWGAIGAFVAPVLGKDARPVRCLLFDKADGNNWGLPWHQDRTIVVRARRDVPGFDHWTVKNGLIHVEPPAALQAGMLTIRLHVDDVDADNAPLLVADGSHRLGRVPESEIGHVVDRSTVRTCIASSGDVWIYATPILHASKRATKPRRRRVVQVDYAAQSLPGGLEWAGI